MVTTPWIRLSENVLSQSITKFYIKNNLVPCGITHDALESWSARMASACNKLVRKFRRLFMENPKSSKLKPLTELKQRCLAAGIQMPEKLVDDGAAGTPPPRLPSHEDLEAIAPAQGGTDRLEALAKIISDKLATKEKREIALKENALAKAAGSSEAHSLNVADCSSGVSLPAEKSDEKKGDAKPVPTPCRGDNGSSRLPGFVLENLEKKLPCPAPFAFNEPKPKAEKTEKPQGKPKKRAKAKSTPAKAKKGKIKLLAGPEAEEALALVGVGVIERGTSAPEDAKPPIADGKQYVAKSFAALRVQFIKQYRSDHGVSYSEANAKWMLSNERASLLLDMPPAELKRRRFA